MAAIIKACPSIPSPKMVESTAIIIPTIPNQTPLLADSCDESPPRLSINKILANKYDANCNCDDIIC